MAMLDTPAPVNLVRSIFLCNLFNFFFAASKACLIPFITIFLKKLGLSATHVGIIIGTKTLVGLVFAPLWAKCAVRCGRRRCMLMFSLFVMAFAYLSLTAVPSIDDSAFATQCSGEIVVPPLNLSNIPGGQEHSNGSVVSNNSQVTSVSSSTNIPSSTTAAGVDESTKKTAASGAGKTTGIKTTESTVTKEQIVTTLPTHIPSATTIAVTESARDKELKELLGKLLITVGEPADKVKELSKAELIDAVNTLLKSPNGEKDLEDALENLPKEDADKLVHILEDEVKRKRRDVSTPSSNQNSSTGISWKSWIIEQMSEIRKQIRETEDQVFAVVLVILMIGEMFSSPIEKIADDGWYEFLESIDDIEKYGMHRVWTSMAFILFPVIVTLSVDNTHCLFGTVIHPFMLHFYMFGVFLGITFLIAFCYPMTTSEKYKYASKVVKGMYTVCCNGRSFMFVVTLLLMGMVYSSYYNYLFWMLLDMGSKEITFGLCLTLAAMSEIPMLLFNSKLVKKIGNGGVVCVSVLFLSARCLYYSFLTTPWAVLPAEITHAFTHTAMWWAVLSTSHFNTSHALSRSIRSILSTAYFGVGFAIGSFLSGFVYDKYGPAILFQAGSVMAIGWFPILAIAMCCCRERDKMEIKYTKLLSSEDASEDSDAMEDDWLEQALKDK